MDKLNQVSQFGKSFFGLNCLAPLWRNSPQKGLPKLTFTVFTTVSEVKFFC